MQWRYVVALCSGVMQWRYAGLFDFYLHLSSFEKLRKRLMASSYLFVSRFVRHHGTTHLPMAINENKYLRIFQKPVEKIKVLWKFVYSSGHIT
jgi:hypothetical protein